MKSRTQTTKAVRESWQAEDYPREIIITSRDLWDNFNVEISSKLAIAVEIVSHWYSVFLGEGGGIILAGDCGCGKTHLLRAIAQLYSLNAQYWNEVDLIGAIQETYNANGSEFRLFKQIDRFELLIYDDLGAYRATDKNIEWLQGIYYNLFNARCENRRPFMIATNLNDADGSLEGRLGKRVYSRVAGALASSQFYVDMFGVPDYRLKDF